MSGKSQQPISVSKSKMSKVEKDKETPCLDFIRLDEIPLENSVGELEEWDEMIIEWDGFITCQLNSLDSQVNASQ